MLAYVLILIAVQDDLTDVLDSDSVQSPLRFSGGDATNPLLLTISIDRARENACELC